MTAGWVYVWKTGGMILQGKAAVLWEQPLSDLLCFPRSPHGLVWDQIQTFSVRCRRLTARPKIVPLCYNVVKCGKAEQATDDNITGNMPFVCWITKTTNTHSEYVILLTFPRQQSLIERASMLRCTYFACLVLHVRVLILTNFPNLYPTGQFVVSRLLKANTFK